MSSQSIGVDQLATAVIIAEELGVHKATINRIARDNAIGHFLGNQRIFSAKEVAKIKRICKVEKGNPNFGKKL